MDTQMLDLLLKDMDERRQMLSQALVTGGVADFPEYKYVVGQIRGLESAMRVIADRKDVILKQNGDAD